MKTLKYILISILAFTSISATAAMKQEETQANGDVYTCVEVNGRLICVKR